MAQLYVVENDHLKATFEANVTYGLVLSSIENLDDGATIDFVASSLARCVTRAVGAADTLTVHEADDASSTSVTLADNVLTFNVYFLNFDGNGSDMVLTVVYDFVDDDSNRLRCTARVTGVYGNGLQQCATMWVAPATLKVARFTSDHYLIPIRGGIVTRDVANDLVGNGTTYRFNTSVGFEPETKASSASDAMEAFYPESVSTALSAYGNRISGGATVYLHDDLSFRPRRIVDSYSGGNVLLEHEALHPNALVEANGYIDGDTTQSFVTYVRVFALVGDVLGEEVGLDYRRWAMASSEGQAILPAKPKDRSDMATLRDLGVCLAWGAGDDRGESELSADISAEVREAFTGIAATDSLSRVASDLLTFSNQTSSGTHPGNVGDAVPDLFDLKVDTDISTYAGTLDDSPSLLLSGGWTLPRNPQPYDGGGYWTSDLMSAARRRNHLEQAAELASPGAYKSTDDWLKVTRTVASVAFSGGFTEVTLSAGALDATLWDLYTTYSGTTGSINHSTHADHLGWVQKSDASYAFPIERQSQANFIANPPIVWVSGDRTATISAGHTLNLFFGGDHFVPGYDKGVAGKVGDNAGTRLCAAADDIGNGTEPIAAGWGVRLKERIATLFRTWGTTLYFEGDEADLVCWGGHDSLFEDKGGNAGVVGWRRILAYLRAQLPGFRIACNKGPFDWQVGLVDSFAVTMRGMDLTTSRGSWGASPFFQTAWGQFMPGGCYYNSGYGHASNAFGEADYGFYYEAGTLGIAGREALAFDFSSGKRPTLGCFPTEDGLMGTGTRPNGADAYTPLNHSTYGVSDSTSLASMFARLVQAHYEFDGANQKGQRVRSLEWLSTTEITSTAYPAVDGHDIGSDELGATRHPLQHFVVRDHADPLRLIVFIINGSMAARGGSLKFRSSWYAEDVPLYEDGYRLTRYEFSPTGVSVTEEGDSRVGWKTGDTTIYETLTAGAVVAYTAEFNSGLKVQYKYDDETIRTVLIPKDQTRVRVEDVHGSGAKLLFGVADNRPDDDWKIASVDLRVVKHGASEAR